MCRIETGFWLVLVVVVHLSPGTVQANRSFKSLIMSLRSTFETACGIPKYNYRNGRIIGGTTSGYGQYPWQINLYQRKSPFQKCGGALLNRHWVVTAAHCVDEFEAQDILVLIGAYNLAEEAHSFAVRKPGIIVVHPLFNPHTYENDLALLRFINPVRYQPNIIPICLPEEQSDFEGQVARISGWGRLFYDGPFPTKLQHASIPVIANSDCEQMYRSVGYANLSIPHIFMCAGYQDGKTDACAGDSGSPLVIRRKDQWVLAGIASWGIGCGERNKPGVYTRISEFVDWIKELIVL